jgi:hypothetical protein
VGRVLEGNCWKFPHPPEASFHFFAIRIAKLQ